MNAFFKATALAAAMASLTTALPATAAVSVAPIAYSQGTFEAPGVQDNDHWRERYSREDRRRGYGNRDRYYRGDRGYRRYDCRRGSGTTGLLLGGAAGALAGRAIDTRGERTTGTVLGAAAGALLGREVDRGGSRCR
ncbi:MAG: glycine zipper protein [Novosphingobium lindaniclasticum]|jgi:hypothetical protein|uniref:17 kDa surface antigen n=1 Tax=Novosphingobium lindaniclasticum LE124 TaxID=1096930 RepID=T0J1P8_9SPHN|nr:glycine zipper 2TM domain-containing protein [Novosphingobium lindaniclasticum]EQB15834.1 hypothetical protein L284_10515 [Novosphingobium lindaniclasticum LE124]MDF2639323.1 glycine zipper protein [Novosphingobium lindaniclasticum]